MYYDRPIGRILRHGAAVPLVAAGCCSSAAGLEQETEILDISIGTPVVLSDLVYQNTSTLMVSRTGVVAAFYPKAGTGPKFYRRSTDRGHTWSEELAGPPELAGGADSGTLREGGVIMPAGEIRVSDGSEEGWYDMPLLRFADDMLTWSVETARLHLPQAGPTALDHIAFPTFAKGKMAQLPNGDVLAPAYSIFKGDSQQRLRAYLLRSRDQGRTWDYYATIAHEPVDPSPHLPGQYVGTCEPSITLLADGRMLAMLRTQYAHPPAEYKPMAVCWSDDHGKTWTKPEATRPHLMCISPTLVTLDNGVVACQYGRPGFHVAFSLDHGRTWQDRISFSHQVEPTLTGQFDLIKAGPNELVAIGSDDGGVKAWPIAVTRGAAARARVALSGRVVDEQGNPIAGALLEYGPNRYAADDWVVDPLGWAKRVRRGNAHPERRVPTEYLPRLSYRSIQPMNGHPTVKTNARGSYRFDNVEPGEYVLTVEADGRAPQHRHIRVEPQPEPQEFTLKPGRRVRGRVIDAHGKPASGVCVVLDQWHCHTDPQGYFHWSVQAPLPERVKLGVHKVYSNQYGTVDASVALSQLENQPITLGDR